MSYDIVIEEKQQYIEVRISGERILGQETKDALDMWVMVAKKCDDAGISRVLIISALTGALPTMSAYAIAKFPEQANWQRKFRTALVDLNEESRQINLFGETVAVNRGYYQVKVFGNEREAAKWLLES